MVSEEMAENEILEGADLCVGCLHPVRPGSDLCIKCGAPHGSLAAILPLLRILAEGYVLRRAIQSPQSWITVIGIWIIFGVNVVSALLLIPVFIGPPNGSQVFFLVMLGGVIVTALLCMAGIVQVTRNFRSRTRA